VGKVGFFSQRLQSVDVAMLYAVGVRSAKPGNHLCVEKVEKSFRQKNNFSLETQTTHY